MLTNPPVPFASVSQFHVYLLWGQRPFSTVGAFNQEKALVGAFSVIVKLRVISGNHRLKFYCIPLPDAAAALPGPRHHPANVKPR